MTTHTYIYRKDTNNYTATDIFEEIQEWYDIISTLTNRQPVIDVNKIVISSRFKTTLAKTSTRGLITVNGDYLAHHSNPQSFHTTLCHEVIHCYPGCFNHGPNFKNLGRIVEKAGYDVTIARTGSDPGYLSYLDEHKRKEEPDRYKAVCVGCGVTVHRARMSKLIKQPWKWRCGKCGGKFRVFEIVDAEHGIENEILYAHTPSNYNIAETTH